MPIYQPWAYFQSLSLYNKGTSYSLLAAYSHYFIDITIYEKRNWDDVILLLFQITASVSRDLFKS